MLVAEIDDVIERARRIAHEGSPDDVIQVRKRSLDLLLAEISTLRRAISTELPGHDGIGQMHRGAMDTEQKAAFAVFPRSGSQRLRVLFAIAYSGDGLNDGEIEHETGIARPSVNPRRRELVYGGWVEDSGRRRPTGAGGEGAVWVLTEKAIVSLRERGYS